MRIQTDANGHITGYAELGDISDGVPYDGDVPNDFAQNYSHYKIILGKLVRDPDYISELDRRNIRARRQDECFAIVDRPLWFSDLPPEKQLELKAWRRIWLDAPETGVTPAPPIWLEGVE